MNGKSGKILRSIEECTVKFKPRAPAPWEEEANHPQAQPAMCQFKQANEKQEAAWASCVRADPALFAAAQELANRDLSALAYCADRGDADAIREHNLAMACRAICGIRVSRIQFGYVTQLHVQRLREFARGNMRGG